MKIWMYGVFGAGLVGFTWTVIWQIVLTVIGILSTGLPLKLQLGPALLAGLFGGWFSLIPRAHFRLIKHFLGFCLITLTIFGFSLGQPYGDENLLSNLQTQILLACTAAISWFSIVRTIENLPAGLLSRYVAELFYIRFSWGIGLMFFVIIVAVPFCVMIMTSLKSQQSLLANPLDFSLDFSLGLDTILRSYFELFTEYNFFTFLINSTLVSVATVLITLSLSIPGAYAVARLRFPGKQWFSASILIGYLIPAIILVIPLYAVFSQMGLRNSLVGLCIVYPATTIPVALYMLHGYFSGLPSELDDAGLMDGLSRWQIILKISMPLSMPAIASVALYVFMIAWNEFLFAFMFLDDMKLFTLSRGIVSLNSSEVPRQHLMAGAVIATIPVLAVFLWFERFLVSGLTAGGVKG